MKCTTHWILQIILFNLVLAQAVAAGENPPLEGFDLEGSDPQALKIADQVMERLGGRANWDETRFLTWRFFGRRLHVWDKWTGDIRFEQGELVVLMNIHSRQGRAWEGGEEVADADTLKARLEHGYRAWINDSYWLFMPYKLKDTGVTLNYGGSGQTDGRPAHILILKFAEVGVTPQNKYEVYVDQEDHLVRQWAFYARAEDKEPRFVGPWSNWQNYGRILLADDRGSRKHTDIAVFEELPSAVFKNPAPVNMMEFAR